MRTTLEQLVQLRLKTFFWVFIVNELLVIKYDTGGN